MLRKVADDLFAFIWDDYTQNNSNSYVLLGEKKILIDPGFEHLFYHVQEGLQKIKVNLDDLDLVLVTHGHPDHLSGAKLFQGKALLGLPGKEYEFIQGVERYKLGVPEPDFFLQEGELQLGDIQLEVIETPGHSPGSICLYWPERLVLFSGDLIFPQGVGRTDLPGGDGEQLKASIRRVSHRRIHYLLSGHGDILAGEDPVRNNFQMIEDYWFKML